MAELKARFRYHPKNYYRADAYQLFKLTGGERGWDGYRYPFQLKTQLGGEILRGRKSELLELCRQLGYQVNLDRCLVSPFKDLKLSDIPNDLIKADFQLDHNQKQAIVEWLKHGIGGANMAVNSGKCLGRGTPVLCFDGSTKAVEEVRVGDLLMGPDSKPRRVLALGSGNGPMFKVVQGNGDAYSCNGDHILALESSGYYRRGSGKYGSKSQRRSSGERIEVSVIDYLKWPKTKRAQHKGYKAGQISFPEAPVMLDPYFLGLWLGNGNSANTTWRLSSPLGKGAGAWKNPLLARLRQLRVVMDKHIPSVYLRNSAEVRWRLLSGLIDTDGAIGAHGVELTFTKERLAADALWLLRSLGLRASLTPKKTTCQTGAEGIAWRIWAKGDFSQVTTAALRKHSWPSPKRGLRYAVKVEEISAGTWFGFTLDGDGLFLLGDFTVTHNTATFAAAAAYVKRHFPDARFLYFTYAERLVKQVMEAMGTFLPDWNITQYGGGGKRDLTGKDMVIATQAILNRNYARLEQQGFFKTFHALLLDECVVGSTVVKLSKGECSIRKIAFRNKPVLVKTYNETTGQIENKTARAVAKGRKPILLVRTKTRAIYCTANHPFLTARGWVSAGDLTCSDNVRCLSKAVYDWQSKAAPLLSSRMYQSDGGILEYTRIVSVTATGRLEEVFDLTVDDNHSFFGNDILIHNSHHCQSPSAEKVLRGCAAYFRLAASDSLKESDPDKFNRISGLCGPVLWQVTSSTLIEQSRSAAPQLYLVDIPSWRGKYSHVSHVPEKRSVAWTLVDSVWLKGTYLGPLYSLNAKGEPKMKRQRRLLDGEWISEEVPIIIPMFHRLELNGAETTVPARFTLLDRRYDKAIIRFKERNQLICDWAKYYSSKGWQTVVVATRTPHVMILEAMLTPLLPGLVRSLTGEASTSQRNEVFAWLNRTPGCVLISPLIKEGVSLPVLRAGIIADVIADFEVAKQIVGRFMRKKEVDNTCSIVWFRDSQCPRYDKNFGEVFSRLEKIEGFTFYYPVAGPETIPQAQVYHGNL